VPQPSIMAMRQSSMFRKPSRRRASLIFNMGAFEIPVSTESLGRWHSSGPYSIRLLLEQLLIVGNELLVPAYTSGKGCLGDTTTAIGKGQPIADGMERARVVRLVGTQGGRCCFPLFSHEDKTNWSSSRTEEEYIIIK